MKPKLALGLLPVVVFGLAVAPYHVAAGPLVIDPAFHHLRNAEPREWSHFPEEADADRLRVSFELESPEGFQLLTLRQEETKQAWSVSVNGRQIATLPRDHNHLEHAIAIPAGLLKQAGNHLEIATKSETPDDIRVGAIVLHRSAEAAADPDRAEELVRRRGFQRVLPAMSARLDLSATDAGTGEPMPCRFTITDAETGALVLLGAESDDRLAIREGVVYSLDGQASVRVAGDRATPRRYRVFCGRGFEFGLGHEEVAVGADDDRALVEFRIRREVPTPGLVACDPHLHTYEFDRHGDCTLVERLVSIAGEGVELPVSTAHDLHIDYAVEAERIGAARWFAPVLGCEVTTDLGHFNSFPVIPGTPPAAHKLRPWTQIFANIFATPGVEVCVLNHGRDLHRDFRPLGPENFDPETGVFAGGRILRANAIELVNSGAQQTDPMRLVRDWFALLRSGHRIAGIGSSDSHTVNFAIPGQARTYLEAPDGDPAQIDTSAAIGSIVAGRTWVSFGLLARLDLDPDPGADLITATVLGPGWTRATDLRLFRNGTEIRSLPIPEAEGSRPGTKFAQTFALADLGSRPGDFLCAVATGPGITDPHWPIMPPYQPTSPDFRPFVMGISPAVWIE
ncbi:hypothetical protein BH23VER1_BH23VER1_25130 [soil metagenome]